MDATGEQFAIEGLGGKKTLSGTIVVRGAKNAALPAMAAAILCKTPLRIENMPNIEDVSRMADLLDHLGVASTKEGERIITIDPRKIKRTDLAPRVSKRLRASVVLTGPMLARMGKVSFPHPGGCVIGARPIDIFISGFTQMGATVSVRKGMYHIRAPKGGLRGAEIFLRGQSVTATETFMMTAVCAKGTTTIRNAAMEPEILDLARFLNASGAAITGAGTSIITIKGNGLLTPPQKGYKVMPDRVEAGSFVILAALTAKKITITHCVPEHIESLLETLKECGVSITTTKNSITVRAPKGAAKATNIKTHEYPGFPTDLQAPMTVFLTQAKGESLVFETIFEGRLQYVEELSRMGADILTMDPHRVIVKGPKALRGRELESPDLRAGLAFIIAATIARGRSIIHNVYNIDRGYEHVEKRLQGVGVKISRVK